MDYQGMEKRRFVRAKFPCVIAIHTLHDHVITTYTENISAGGVRVVIEEKLELSSTVGLEIQICKNIIVCKGRIVWVVDRQSPYKKNILYHDTGIEFYEIKESDRRIISDAIEEILKGEK
ncbi:MAG: PilZ domain-containing protein [Candidatus Omnitrophota bacterium]